MDKNLQLTEYDLKQIAYEIFEEEEKEHNIKINAFPLNLIEYFKKVFSDGKLSLKKINNFISTSSYCSGANCLDGNIFIFLNNIKKIHPIEKRIFYLAKTCYHEARHSVQLDFDKFSYSSFLSKMENYSLKHGKTDYYINHDLYSYEIGANLYAVRKAREYVKKKFPDLYKKFKEEIDKLEEKYYLDYFNYDPVFVLENFLSLAKKEFKKAKVETLKKLNVDENETNVVFIFPKKIFPVLDIFLDGEFNFKKVKDIVENEKFKTLDKQIIYTCFSSKPFLEHLNLNELSSEELELVNESLQYSINLYKKQAMFIEEKIRKKKISLFEYLSAHKQVLNKIKFLNNYYSSYFSKRMDDVYNQSYSEKAIDLSKRK